MAYSISSWDALCYIYIYIYMYTHIYICNSFPVICICIYVYIYLYIKIYIFVYIYSYLYISFIHIYIYIFIYLYMYLFIYLISPRKHNAWQQHNFFPHFLGPAECAQGIRRPLRERSMRDHIFDPQIFKSKVLPISGRSSASPYLLI